MKIKKWILIIVVIILIVFSCIYIFNYFNNVDIFKKYLNYSTQLISNRLENDTISGNANLNVNVDSYIKNNNVIIENTNYKINYQISLKEGYVILNSIGLYDNNILESDILLNNNKIYILLNDIFDKYIVYDNNYFEILNNLNDYSTLIVNFNNEFNKILKPKHFNQTSLKNDKLIKITLDLTREDNSDLNEQLIEKLSENNEFIQSFSNIIKTGENISKDEVTLKMNDIDMSKYKISLYLSKKTKEFNKIQINNDEIDFNIEYKDNKYYYQYYLRDGLVYEGNFSLNSKNKLKDFKFSDILKNYSIDLNFNNLQINYNKKIEELDKNILSNNILNSELSELEKNVIIKNNEINSIYNKYLNRYDIETEGKNEIDEVLENTNEENLFNQ